MILRFRFPAGMEFFCLFICGGLWGLRSASIICRRRNNAITDFHSRRESRILV